MQWLYRILGIILIATLSAFSKAPDVPLNIDSVNSGGYWEYGGKSGEYRVVVVSDGWEHVHSRVYLQWIAADENKHSFSLAATVPIDKINREAVWTAGAPKILFSKNRVNFSIPLTHTYSAENRSITIVPQAKPGVYKILK